MVRVLIVGAGSISGRHVQSIAQLPNAKIVGIVDPDQERAGEKAKLCGADIYQDIDDCLDKADMVFVLTPPSTHRAIAVKAMRAGKHVMVEKPISATIEDAQAMIDEAALNHVKLMVGFNMRFRTGFKKLKEITDSGKLGDITTYWCQRMGLRVDSKNKWSTDPLLMTGMCIQSLSHDIDTMRWIAGDVTDVRAQVLETRKDLPGFDNNANAVLSLAGGGTAVIQSSWSSHLFLNTRGVIGTKGTAYVHGNSLWDLTTFHWKTDEMEYEQIETINDIHDVRSFRAEDTYFINCVDNDTEPSITGADGLRALEVSYAMLQANRENRIVTL